MMLPNLDLTCARRHTAAGLQLGDMKAAPPFPLSLEITCEPISKRVRWQSNLPSSVSRRFCGCISPSTLGGHPIFSHAGPSLRCAVLGAGFAGLSFTWHLLRHAPKEFNLHVDIFDEFGVGGGASGVSGGLLHPYSPKVKLLWRGADCWRECLDLLSVAEAAAANDDGPQSCQDTEGFIVRRRGILRPAVSEKHLNIMHENAQNSLASCRIEVIDGNAARDLVPNFYAPLNSAFFMPEAVNVNPPRYLQALFLACQNLVVKSSASGVGGKNLCLRQEFIPSLGELGGVYDAVIICLGARVDMLPELSGKLPLRTCRGIISHLQLPADFREEYGEHSPSILSDAWLAVQGRRTLHLGSTWEWKSRNFSPDVTSEEVARALDLLLPKASAIYPGITSWRATSARAGLRAMPPLTLHGSLPLLGCINDIVGYSKSRYWLIGGLGSRGLLYHGWLGKLTAKAVLACNDDSIPSELISWKKVKKKLSNA